jgi:hypothetical protein
MFKIISAGLLALVFVSGCAGSPGSPGSGANKSQAEAEAAAAAGFSDLDTATGRGGSQGAASSSRSSASSSSSSSSANRAEPAWVISPDNVYSRDIYVAAVGYGGERGAAEKNALAALTALFGQSVQADLAATVTYSEAVLNGAVSSYSENTAITNAVKTSSELNSLVGAEIKDYWYDSKSTHYAAAVMEKAKTAALYADMIRSNEKIISDLTTMTAAVKNSLGGYSRYILAGTIADANRAFANVLSVVGNANTGIKPGDMKKGDDYRLEAVNIAKSIPIAVELKNDSTKRLQGAFAAAVNKAGFSSGGSNSRYRISGDISFTPLELPNQPNKFVRYTLDANLIDTSTNSVLLPFTFTGREGHLTVAEAENRAVSAAERQVNEKYGALLSEYLSKLLPDKK